MPKVVLVTDCTSTIRRENMSRIAVIADSTSNIPQELRDLYNIRIAPLGIKWGEGYFRDGIDITPKEFYTRLRTSKILPFTEGAIQGEWLLLFEELRGKVEGVVAITLSSDLSACYRSALTAREMFPDLPIEVIDSRLSVMAEGWVVLAAARAAISGATMEEVVRVAKETIPKVNIFAVLDTLKHLHRIGRLSAPKALIADLMKVKPILTLKDGKAVPLDKARTKPKAIERILELTRGKVKNTPLHMAIFHADALEEAERLKERIATEFKPVELLVTDFTPILGVASGPGAIGVAFYNERI